MREYAFFLTISVKPHLDLAATYSKILSWAANLFTKESLVMGEREACDYLDWSLYVNHKD